MKFKKSLTDYFFACNGELLMIQPPNKPIRFYDVKTGMKVGKLPHYLEAHVKLCHDNVDSFFQIDGEMNMKKVTLKFFKKAGGNSASSSDMINKRVSIVRDHLLNKKSIENREASLDELNVIERLMQGVTVTDLVAQSNKQGAYSQGECNKSNAKAVILSYIDQAVTNFEKKVEEAKSNGSIEKETLTFFKCQNATFLTSEVFEQLQSLLQSASDKTINLTKTSANLADQYHLYFLLRILYANFQALNLCRLALPSLLRKHDKFAAFIQTYKATVLHLVESGYLASFEGHENIIKEMQELWGVHIKGLSLRILSNSMSLIYSDNSEILESLRVNLAEASTDVKKSENCVISLDYLLSSNDMVNQLVT